MIELDKPQIDFVNAIDNSFAMGNRAIIARAATGFGKTVVASYVANRTEARGQRVMMSVHRRALLTQTSKTFNKFNVYYGYIAAGMPRDPFAPVQLASIDTLKNCYEDISFVPDIFFVDEAHLSLAEGWMEVLEYFKSKGTKIIGLTATPEVMGDKSFTPFYTDIVCSPSEKWLMNNINPRTGKTYLSGYDLYVAQPPELEGVGHSDDYIKKQLSAWLRESSIVGDSAESWDSLARGKRTIAFRVSIEDSIDATEKFNAMGIRSEHLDADTPEHARRDIIERFAYGETDVLSNCNIFSEGFDLSAQVDMDVPIEAVILECPTLSFSKHAQQAGRSFRPKFGNAILLDHVGNTYRHGLPDVEHVWTLDGRLDKNTDLNIEDDRFQLLPQVVNKKRKGGGGARIARRVEGQLVEITQQDREIVNDGAGNGENAAIRILRRIAEKKGMDNAGQWAQDEYQRNQSANA